jgi:alkylhydroperoxidase/carboxymuconolactone decarboxylase family protein YurZ
VTEHTKPKHAFEQYEWLARMDPGYDSARRRLAGEVWTPGKPALEVKYREIVAATVLAYRTYPSVESHLRSAVEAGATLREILEGLQAGATLGGFTVLHYTIPYLIALNEEFGDDIIDGPGAAKRTSSPTPATGAVSRGMREWAWLDKVDPDYYAARIPPCP